MSCTNIQASLDYIKRLSLSCGRSISSWRTSVPFQPRPQPLSVSLGTSRWLICVISEEFISVLSPSGLIIHPENREERHPSISASLHPSIYLSLLSPMENKHPPPQPCLIVHIVIGDISINLVICSWVCLLCFPSSICSFCNYLFFLRFLSMRDFGQKTFPYHSTFSYFLEWFIFQMPCFLFASSLFLNYVWFDHVGWEVSFVWGVMSQIQLIVFGLCWKWAPFFTVVGTLGSGLLAQLFLMFLFLFECLWKPFFCQKKERTDSTRGCEMCYSTYERALAVQEVIDFMTYRAVRHKLTSVDCVWLPAGLPLHSIFMIVWLHVEVSYLCGSNGSKFD